MNSEPTFTSAEIADLADLDAKTIQNWSSRFGMGATEGGKGKHRLFSFPEAVLFALMKVLVREFMLGPEAALRFAEIVTHTGSGQSGWGEKLSGPVRKPMLPFHYRYGTTFLMITPNVALVRPFESSPQEFFGGHVLAVNITQIFQQVCSRLSWNAQEILDAAYPHDAGAADIIDVENSSHNTGDSNASS
ncbi:MAG: hypothetical protein GKR98_03075 [Boseongicola sp.]|nr:MAG: hypothetical protein GKR98_03075 [Boseongicola sp.]